MQCEGSMYPLGTANKPVPRRVTCPACKKNLRGVWRMLGPHGSCSGAELYVPNHAAQRMHHPPSREESVMQYLRYGRPLPADYFKD